MIIAVLETLVIRDGGVIRQGNTIPDLTLIGNVRLESCKRRVAQWRCSSIRHVRQRDVIPRPDPVRSSITILSNTAAGGEQVGAIFSERRTVGQAMIRLVIGLSCVEGIGTRW